MPWPAQLLRWYRANGRKLPWRTTRDPYRILVSEIMLQQTQVPRVLFFYRAWLKRFPNWKALAAASNAEVIRTWSGLGYNRRALALRDMARQVISSGIPHSQEGWQKLKGIGPYTSAAIAMFAHHQRVLPVDTNIRRVLGRMLLGIPYPQDLVDLRLQKRTDEILPANQPFWDIPQALFDLATDMCQKSPRCALCPLRSECKAASKFLKGNVRIPKAMIKKAPESRHKNKPYPDRIYRGRILKAIQEDSVRLDDLGPIIDPSFETGSDAEWLKNMLTRMESDKLLLITSSVVRLPPA